MITAKQQQYVRHDANSGSRLTAWIPSDAWWNSKEHWDCQTRILPRHKISGKTARKGSTSWSMGGSSHSKLHEYSVLTVHKILTSRRVLPREKTDKTRQNRPDPPYVYEFPFPLGYGLFFMILAACVYASAVDCKPWQYQACIPWSVWLVLLLCLKQRL